MRRGALREIPNVFGPHGVTSDVHIYKTRVTSSLSCTSPTPTCESACPSAISVTTQLIWKPHATPLKGSHLLLCSRKMVPSPSADGISDDFLNAM